MTNILQKISFFCVTLLFPSLIFSNDSLSKLEKKTANSLLGAGFKKQSQNNCPKSVECSQEPKFCNTLFIDKCSSKPSFTLDVLYFKAIEDSLKYGENDSNFSNYPISDNSKTIQQKFKYSPGIRVSLNLPAYDCWMLGFSYTHFSAIPQTTHAQNNDGALFGSLIAPVYYAPVNENVSNLSGKWTLRLESFDALLKKKIILDNSFLASIFMGLQGCSIHQKVNVNYTFFNPRPSLASPQSVRGYSSLFGIGPKMGAELKLIFPYAFSFFAKGSFSCILGAFKTTTKYSRPIISNAYDNISLKDNPMRICTVSELQMAFSKWWTTSNCIDIEFTIGWETQVWSRQMRMNWFNTLSSPPDGSDLTLHGPFANLSIWF